VGEVQAALPLIEKIRSTFPNQNVVVTTTTPTGSERVKKHFGNQVWHSYLPYDLQDLISGFINHINPKVALVMETELWPCLFQTLGRRKIPLSLVNARLSPSSYRGYSRIRPFIRAALSNCSLILTQSDADAKRYQKLGVKASKVQVCGNLKFDVQIPELSQDQGQQLRLRLGQHRPVWIAASTHPGEEQEILAAHRTILATHPQALLILVPRHPERFQQVFELCMDQGFQTVRRSLTSKEQTSAQVYLGDSMGELPLFFAASDIAFVGGSLVPVGGHNLLEPAAMGLPVLSGEHLFNFKEIARLLEDSQAMQRIQERKSLSAKVSSLIDDEKVRKSMGQKGIAAVEDNKGATERTLSLVSKLWTE
jgi:3-deoxy-D-manno-octulosonic-acid transferase